MLNFTLVVSQSEYFINSGKGDRKFIYNGLKKVVESVRKDSSVQFTNNGLRHTFATLMANAGCDIYSLAQMLGHSDKRTTTIYLSSTVTHLQDQIAKHPMNNF